MSYEKPKGVLYIMNDTTWNGLSRDGVYSRQVFYAIVAGLLCYGFGLAAFTSTLTASVTPTIGFLLTMLAIGIVGIIVASQAEGRSKSNSRILAPRKSRSKPLLGWVGMTLLFGALGAVIGPLLANLATVEPGIITKAALTTAGVAVVMGMSGIAFPRFYQSIGGALFVALIALVAVAILRIFFPVLGAFHLFEMGGVALFSLFIGYDMHRAHTMEATFGGAVDVAMSLFLDLANLFLFVVDILLAFFISD